MQPPDAQTRLAVLRTLLAKKRTALAELQLGIVLVTLPLTVHTGIVILSSRHEGASRLHGIGWFWIFLGGLLAVGIAFSVHAARTLIALRRQVRACERSLTGFLP